MIRRPPPRHAAGFALILALFMLVSLAAIGAYMLTVSTAQVEAGVQDEQGSRAYQAARAGIEWGAFQVLENPAGNFATTRCTDASTEVIVFAGGLAGFRVAVTCQVFGPETEGSSPVSIYRLTATGCNSGTCPEPAAGVSPTYVERQLQLTLTR
ncbi:MAG: agglutinin biogenesis protein MshP [Betaproteobacteria bacterium]